MPSRYARAAGTVLASMAARDAYKGARTLLSSKRKKRTIYYKNRLPLRPTYPTGTGLTKRTLVTNTVGKSLSTRTLYADDLTWITHAEADNKINHRQREIINCRGFKLNLKVKALNGPGTVDNAVMFHWAVIMPRFTSIDSAAGAAKSDMVSTSDFFRGNGENRNINFQKSLGSNEFNSLGINTDIYTVLRRGVKRLNPYPAAFGAEGGCFGEITDFIPFNRQVRYDKDPLLGPVATVGRTILVYWCEYFSGIAVDTNPIAAAALLDQHCVTYWKEP